MKCEKLFNIIEEMEGKYLDILEEVCNIESPTDFKEGVDKVGKYFLDFAKEKGWKTEVLNQEISGDALLLTLDPDAKGAPVSLSGHMDTVHPVGSFGPVPVRRDEEKMYGPGVMDCKGGIVAALMAMEALDKCGFKNRPVHLLLQSDEENSSATSNKETIKYICEKAKGSVAFLNLEGIKGNTAVIRRKGILRYLFTVHGKALHSSRCAEAANAVAEAAYKIIELEKMKNPDGLTCNCGVISGGTKANTVADKCSFYADIRFSTDEELIGAKKKCKEVSDNITVEGCSCTLDEVSFRPAMAMSDKNINLLEKMNEIYKENGLPELTPRACLSGSDAAYVTECGIPCVDNLGTEGGNIHSVNEYITLASLAASAKRIAALIYCI
ncbi:MAG: M20/M25/M40 family metallo-hydrolase [Clostridia bacterium]|nr:M20/M25/M40 family metallo-hydrolase [Clostridia bacterium]